MRIASKTYKDFFFYSFTCNEIAASALAYGRARKNVKPIWSKEMEELTSCSWTSIERCFSMMSGLVSNPIPVAPQPLKQHFKLVDVNATLGKRTDASSCDASLMAEALQASQQHVKTNKSFTIRNLFPTPESSTTALINPSANGASSNIKKPTVTLLQPVQQKPNQIRPGNKQMVITALDFSNGETVPPRPFIFNR